MEQNTPLVAYPDIPEKMFHILVGSITEYAIIMLDPAGRIATWSPAAERLKGYCAGEILGRHFSVLYTPEDVASNKTENELGVAIREGRFEDDGWRVRKDGSRFWANVVITALRDEGGNLLGFGKITRDLTDRKRAADQFQLAIEAAPTGMILVDQRGRIALANAQVEKFFGYKRAELVGQSIEVLVPVRFRGGHQEFRTNFFADPKARAMGAGRDLYGLRKDGTEMPIEIALNPLETIEGKFVLGSVIDITERKRAEMEILKNKDVLEKFVEYAPASIAMFDRNMLYVVASRRWHQQCGIGDQSIVGKSHYDVLPTLPEHWKTRHQRGLAGETLKAEEEWVALDGSKQVIRWEIHPWGDAGGSTGGIIIFMEDITERRRSAEQFRLALEAAPTGMIMIDQRGKIVLVNAQVDKMFGYGRAELMGQSIEILVPERFRGRHPEFRTNFFVDPKTRPMGAGRDLYGLRKDGTEMPIEIGLTPLETLEGKFVLSSVVDITERKRAAADQFRLAIEASPTGMIMVDQRGKIVLVNAQVETIFGYGRAELMGQRMEMLLPERYRDNHAELRTSFSAHPKVRQVGSGLDLWGLRKDGTEIPLEIGLNPLETSEGKFVLSSVVDVTERKRAEQERESLLGKLQTFNTELGTTLKERETLLQEVHHRVKNNLQVISSLISLQVRSIKDPASREALQGCQARVQAISLIHAMLYQSADYANVPFSEYASTLAGHIFNAVGTVPGQVSLDLDINDVALPVDKAIPSGLILNELITNALKHGFPDGRCGTIRVALGEVSRGKLQLLVEDDGVGMAAGFDLAQSQTLGMHLVSALAEQLGAEFEISKDKGTSFKFTFANP